MDLSPPSDAIEGPLAPSSKDPAAYLIRFELEPGPPDRLPAEAGLLEAAEEHGLLWVVQVADRVHALRDGLLWGEFPTAALALEAFAYAAKAASELLGFAVTPVRALAFPFDGGCMPLTGAGRPVMASLPPAGRFAVSLFHQLYGPPARWGHDLVWPDDRRAIGVPPGGAPAPRR